LRVDFPRRPVKAAQDLARGRPGEIDHLNGAVVRRRRAAGIDTPVNRALHLLVKMLEAKTAARS
jgi:2-dehydropantoate 2-reductase